MLKIITTSNGTLTKLCCRAAVLVRLVRMVVNTPSFLSRKLSYANIHILSIDVNTEFKFSNR